MLCGQYNKKIVLIEQHQITKDIELQVPIELNTDKIAVDLAAILGNLLDNAIEATNRAKTVPTKEISINIKYNDNKIYIQINNTSDKSKQDFSQKIVISEKGSNRFGIGITSIKERVERLKGYYDFKYDAGYFKAFIILPVEDVKTLLFKMNS